MSSLENWDDPKLNQRLLAAVEQAIQQCVKAYEGRARSFAVILNDLEVLSTQLHKKMNLGKAETTTIPLTSTEKKLSESELANKKPVYIRLFHREMPNLLMQKASKGWIKPLLESIKTAEKHGLAIYSNEEYVRKSLKGECYGYATLIIDEKQDITSKRPIKTDPILQCPLLTISDIEISNLIKFTYNNVDYMIKDGILNLPTTNNSDNK